MLSKFNSSVKALDFAEVFAFTNKCRVYLSCVFDNNNKEIIFVSDDRSLLPDKITGDFLVGLGWFFYDYNPPKHYETDELLTLIK